jgi:hypothetical protein
MDEDTWSKIILIINLEVDDLEKDQRDVGTRFSRPVLA